ncbi:hypothetical protein C7S18_08255 [Ahniella affigens]|uniref:DNA-binding response regulator n=1 Tax=Ahniella affigens TaxID=2021234 RepID=A0A2P1PQR2_9GAMM|nr:LytTR family DNA-binding domain-containing protein [Ahniella affigens]AVP97186.1 hypothetical protein C7S18_08255 [Ahniella affigens]
MSAGFSVYIAEDEPLARESLLGMFLGVPGWHVIGSADNGETALHECLLRPPDVLLTDIRMPRLNGLELVACLREEVERLNAVFITAYDQHAIAAFRLAAVDYLLKPVADSEFQACLARVKKRIAEQRALHLVQENHPQFDALLRHQRKQLRRLVVRSVGRTEIVPLSDVIAFSADGNYMEVVTATRRLLHRQTMKSLLAQLDQDAFIQVHRSVIVAKVQVRALKNTAEGMLVLTSNGTEFPVSQRYVDDLRRALSNS